MDNQVTIYEVKSSARENASMLFSEDRSRFYWSDAKFKKLNLGDYVIVVDKSSFVLLGSLAKRGIASTGSDGQTSFTDEGSDFTIAGSGWGTFARLDVISLTMPPEGWHWQSLGNVELVYINGPNINKTTAERRLVNIRQLQQLADNETFQSILKVSAVNFEGQVAGTSLIKLLKEFMFQADKHVPGEPFVGAPAQLIDQTFFRQYRGLKVKASFGMGLAAAVPWLCFLGDEQIPSNGIFPAYLSFKQQRILVLAYGISETEAPTRSWTGIRGRQTIAEFFERKGLEPPRAFSRSLVHSTYGADEEFDEQSMRRALDEVIDHYKRVLGDPMPDPVPYTREDALADLFIPDLQLDQMITRLERKKNLILQGPPGVGKTYVAKRLAYLLMGVKDTDRVEMIQFHQSYTYEDFIQGYRLDQSGAFLIRQGIFHQFCDRARHDEASGKKYVFIIDEINRGNLGKIFGELMMLIEPDKRGAEFAMPLAYSSAPFYVPDNVFVIGTMNTADRSLSLVDYALRRRFSFVNLSPRFESPKFALALGTAGATPELVTKIVSAMSGLNGKIAADTRNLGPGFCIGHSYFCPRQNASVDEAWYRDVLESEIGPLMEEYWLDDPSKAAEFMTDLLT